MVTLTESRELLMVVALIGGFAGAFLFFDAPFEFIPNTLFSFSHDVAKIMSTPTPSHAPRVLGAATRIELVANPVVHIDIPPHNIFESQ